MTAERWRRIQQVFQKAVDSDITRRDEVLASETAGDDEMRREVEKMLRHAFGSGPLDQPAWDGTPIDEGPSIGARLGPYELVQEAGAGGMGRVFKARDTRLDRIVAIKVLSAEFSHRFQAEARAISALNHPHVCVLHDIGEQEGTAYLVMEYVEGESLASRLRSGALPIHDVLLYGSQIAAALAAAHKLGIVHRDLKPANIMITEGGVKVLDFGVAHMGAHEEPPNDSPHLVAGTLAYMSPSQLNGNPPDTRSDIFSLGLVLKDMAAGRGGSGLAALIDRCLDEDASRRPQTMDEVRFALDRMRAKPAQASVRRMRVAWLIVFLVAARTGGVLLWKAIKPSPPAVSVVSGKTTPDVTLPAPAPAPPPAVKHVSEAAPSVIPGADPPVLLRLTSYAGFVRDPSISPDGKKVAFARSGPRGSGYGIEVMAATPDALPQTLTDGGSQDWGPSWSPDGRTLAFRRGGGHSGIYVVPAAGGEPDLLAPIARQHDQTLPQMSWSPDGKWIAAPDRDPTGGTQIYLFPVSGGDKRVMTANYSGTDHAPAFSPNGRSLAFTRCEYGVENCDVYVIDLGRDATPKSLRRITNQGFYTRGVAWLPDGHGLVYSAGTGAGRPMHLWRVSVNPPGEPEQVEMAGSRANHPTVAHHLVAFTDFNPSNWRLMLIQNFR